MNKLMILIMALLLITNYTIAQDTTNKNQLSKTVKTLPFTITKGYYSIYKNAEKLNHQPAPVVVKEQTTSDYNKGFYAIGSKQTHLYKGGKSFIATTPKQRNVTKGYYSIKPVELNTPDQHLVADAGDTTHTVRDEN